MAYDLAFWRELTPAGDPKDVYERLMDDEDVECLAALPLERVKQRFREVFPEIEDEGTEMTWEGAGSYFQLTWPPDPVNALLVSCGFKLLESPETMNQLIDTATSFGCALYDPQVGKRFLQTDSDE